MTTTDQMADLLETLCPMFVLIDATGRIRRVGPTLQKLRPKQPMVGADFLQLFELVRPRMVSTMPALMATAGGRLQLRFRDEPRTGLKGLIAPLPDDAGAVVNLSFGISILDAVRDYALTSADFSGTDLAIELLYLVEAKSAAMEASRSLNLRLQGAMLAAEEQAYTDTLTGLKNRRAMDHILGHLIRSKSKFALMHLDLDFFKSVNDQLGHAAGDYVLQQAARIMLEETRHDDTVARIGGDEFVFVFKDLMDPKTLCGIAERIIARLQEPMTFEGETCEVSASIGTALSTQFDNKDWTEVLNAADQALYEAKKNGRARHVFYGNLTATPAKSDVQPLA